MFLYPWGDMHSLNLGWFLLQFKDWVEKIQEYLDNGGGTSENLANVIAPVFNAANSYSAGDYVLYNNELYKANQAVNPGTWDPTAWDNCLIVDEMGSGGAGVDNVARLMIAGQYSATYGYQKYAICRYNDKLWMCNTNLPSGGEAWNASHWDEITVGAGLTGLRRSVDTLSDRINDISTTTNTLFTLDGLQIGKNASGASFATRAISADIYCPDGITVKAAYLPTNLKYAIEYYSADDLSTWIGEFPSNWITDNNIYTSPSSVTQTHFRILFATVDNNTLTASDFDGLVLQVNNGNKLEITAKDKDARLTAEEAKNTADCGKDALENWGDALVSLTWHYNTTTVPANDGVTVMPNNSAEKLSRWYFIGINQIVTGSKKLLIRGVVGYSGELNLVNISDTDIDFAGNMQVRFFDPLVLQNFFT